MSEMQGRTTNALSRRAFLKYAGMSTAAVALAACAAPSATAPSAGGATVEPAKEAVALRAVSFSIDEPAFTALADEYMKRNPNVTVAMEFLPTDETYYSTLQTQYAGGSNPDIATMQGWGFQIFAENDVLHGMNALRERDDFNYAWADNQVVRDYTERNGETWLAPTQLATMVMFYARKLFDDAGLAYPTDDWTFDEFVEISQKLTRTDGDKKQWGYQTNGNWYRDIHWIRGTGKQELDTLIDPRKSQFSQPEIAEIVQLVEGDFIHKLGISPSPADTAAGSGSINSGQAAMKYEGPWWFPQMVTTQMREEGTAIDFDVVLMPIQQDEDRPHRGWAEGVTMLDTAPADAAWDLVKFITGEDGQKIFSQVSGRIPNNSALIESFWEPMVQEQFGLTNTKAFLTALGKGEIDIISGLPRSQYWNEVIRPVGWDPIIGGSATAAEVMPQVDVGVQKLLDDYWAANG